MLKRVKQFIHFARTYRERRRLTKSLGYWADVLTLGARANLSREYLQFVSTNWQATYRALLALDGKEPPVGVRSTESFSLHSQRLTRANRNPERK